jgi:hypothetical protein
MAIELFEHGFRIVCFFVFVAALAREIYRKLFPSLKDLYEKYKKFIDDKWQNKERIIKQKEEVLQSIEKQHEQGKCLTEKVMIWAQKEHFRRDKKNQENIHSQEALKQYMIEQSKFLALTTARKELMPEIIAHVTDAICTIYSNTDEQKKYTKNILAALESRLHD